MFNSFLFAGYTNRITIKSWTIDGWRFVAGKNYKNISPSSLQQQQQQQQQQQHACSSTAEVKG